MIKINKKTIRANKIVEVLKEKKGASVKELAQMLNVSEMTIRRDLAILNKNNIIHNISGASIYNASNNHEKLEDEYDINNQKIVYESEKTRIGRAAAQMIEEDDIIIIDSGTTTEMLARNISNNVKITALIYSMNILLALKDKPNIDMIFAGGYYRANTQMFESYEGLELIKKTRGTKVFVSAAGIHKELGITCANGYELSTKRAIMESCLQKILLVDSSKFNTIKSVHFTDLEKIHTIITDNSISEEWKDYIKSLNIELICV
ncbi:MAG: DeoR/GlpR family DNA-binding transcription regulator [Cellulosilyticaceae bacterium]